MQENDKEEQIESKKRNCNSRSNQFEVNVRQLDSCEVKGLLLTRHVSDKVLSKIGTGRCLKLQARRNVILVWRRRLDIAPAAILVRLSRALRLLLLLLLRNGLLLRDLLLESVRYVHWKRLNTMGLVVRRRRTVDRQLWIWRNKVSETHLKSFLLSYL